MMNEEQIRERLEAAGQKESEIRAALQNVGKVIIAATAAAYMEMLPEDKRARIQSLSQEELEQYVSEHQEEFPRMSQETFEKIHDQTWEDYFASIVE
jgi:hypothetical protein